MGGAERRHYPEDARQIADLIEKAAPCQDFSIIVDGPGHGGDRGSLFLITVKLMNDVRQLVNAGSGSSHGR